MKHIEWISEEEAAAMVGLPPLTFRRYVQQKKLRVGYFKITYKSKPQYNKADIVNLQLAYQVTA